MLQFRKGSSGAAAPRGWAALAGAPWDWAPWGCPGTALVPSPVPSARAAARRHRRDSREQQGEGNQLVVAGDMSSTPEPASGSGQPTGDSPLPWGHLCGRAGVGDGWGRREQTWTLLSSQSRARFPHRQGIYPGETQPVPAAAGGAEGLHRPGWRARCLPSALLQQNSVSPCPALPAQTFLRRGPLAGGRARARGAATSQECLCVTLPGARLRRGGGRADYLILELALGSRGLLGWAPQAQIIGPCPSPCTSAREQCRSRGGAGLASEVPVTLPSASLTPCRGVCGA